MGLHFSHYAHFPQAMHRLRVKFLVRCGFTCNPNLSWSYTYWQRPFHWDALHCLHWTGNTSIFHIQNVSPEVKVTRLETMDDWYMERHIMYSQPGKKEKVVGFNWRSITSSVETKVCLYSKPTDAETTDLYLEHNKHFRSIKIRPKTRKIHYLYCNQLVAVVSNRLNPFSCSTWLSYTARK